MEAETTYNAIKSRYPKEIAYLIKKLRSGKSIHKNAAPEELDWYFHYGHRLHSISFQDLFNGVKSQPSPNDIKDVVGRAEAWIACTTVSLCAKIGRWWNGKLIADVPQEVKDKIYDNSLFSINEEKNRKPLTQKEFNDLLAGGLAVFRIEK